MPGEEGPRIGERMKACTRAPPAIRPTARPAASPAPVDRPSGRADLNAALDLSIVPSFDGSDGVSKCLLQNALTDGPEHEGEHPALEVLALAYHDGVHISRSFG